MGIGTGVVGDATPNKADSGDPVFKWLGAGLAVAASGLTIAGLSGAQVSRLTRIHPAGFKVGVTLLVLSTVLGVFGLLFGHRGRLLVATLGVGAFFAGMSVLVWFHADATSKQERPTATISLTGTGELTADVRVKAAGLRQNEYVFVLVQGFNSQKHLDPESATFASGQSEIAPGQYSKQRIYKGRIGPSPDGSVDIGFKLTIAQKLYEQVVVQALIARPRDRALEQQLETGKPNPKGTTTFACDSVSARTSCATVLMPSPPDLFDSVRAVA